MWSSLRKGIDMKRRLFTMLSAISFLLFVAVVVLFLVNRQKQTRLGFVARGHVCLLTARPGGVYVAVTERHTPVQDEMLGLRVEHRGEFNPGGETWRVPGLRAGAFDAYDGTVNETRVMYVMPSYGLLACASAILPATWITHRRLWRKRESRGRCAHCGYDLRATPERCPECGAVPARASA